MRSVSDSIDLLDPADLKFSLEWLRPFWNAPSVVALIP